MEAFIFILVSFQSSPQCRSIRESGWGAVISFFRLETDEQSLRGRSKVLSGVREVWVWMSVGVWMAHKWSSASPGRLSAAWCRFIPSRKRCLTQGDWDECSTPPPKLTLTWTVKEGEEQQGERIESCADIQSTAEHEDLHALNVSVWNKYEDFY